MAREGSRKLGQHYEGVAARYLESRGIRIIERNVHNRGGEIDLIGMDAEALVFFEVRFRADGALVDPISSVSAVKQQRLVRAASFYLHRHGLWAGMGGGCTKCGPMGALCGSRGRDARHPGEPWEHHPRFVGGRG